MRASLTAACMLTAACAGEWDCPPGTHCARDGVTRPGDIHPIDGLVDIDPNITCPVDERPREFSPADVPDGWEEERLHLRYSLVILPDTQNYLDPMLNVDGSHCMDLFISQVEWLRDHVDQERIAFVLHEGDVTQTNTDGEWSLASDLMGRLDGVVPYALTLGNHDLGPAGEAKDRSTWVDAYFPPDRFRAMGTLGGLMDPASVANAFHLFEADGDRYLVLALEFAPRDLVLQWAAGVARDHPDRQVILLMHDYLYFDGHPTQPDDEHYPFRQCGYGVGQADGGTCNDGQSVWEHLVAPASNIRFVFSGHHLGDGTARSVARARDGKPVLQALANYQMRHRGGDGWLRVLRFLDDGTLSTWTYSPALERWLTDGQNRFRYEPARGRDLP
ncbi:MAG: metallophosphoesterase [Deltaproteobacteria bacterium]|nr:metallophosphoesterase [Deltaproteobacteria bacterium]